MLASFIFNNKPAPSSCVWMPFVKHKKVLYSLVFIMFGVLILQGIYMWLFLCVYCVVLSVLLIRDLCLCVCTCEHVLAYMSWLDDECADSRGVSVTVSVVNCPLSPESNLEQDSLNSLNLPLRPKPTHTHPQRYSLVSVCH